MEVVSLFNFLVKWVENFSFKLEGLIGTKRSSVLRIRDGFFFEVILDFDNPENSKNLW